MVDPVTKSTEAALEELYSLHSGEQPPSPDDLAAWRKKNNFERAPDGRVTIFGKGKAYALRTDGWMSGAVLARDEEGYAYIFPTTMTQVDLSDDVWVAYLFSNPDLWEQALVKIQIPDPEDDKKVVDAQTETDWNFRVPPSVLVEEAPATMRERYSPQMQEFLKKREEAAQE